MARVGGRSTWFAWFVGIVCAGVVGALAVLAVPMVPSAASWVGELVRGAVSAPIAGDDEPAAPAPAPAPSGASIPADCAALYPVALYELISTASGVTPRVDPQPPQIADPGLASTLAAQPALTCAWDAASGASIVTSVSRVVPTAPDLTATALSAAGFACTPTGVSTHCERTSGGVLEVHDARGGVWVVSVLDGWQPPGYAQLIASQIWP